MANLPPEVDLLNYQFGVYQENIVRLLKRPRRARIIASDADTLNGQTVNQLLAGARSDLAAHAANTNNPHQETIQTIGSLPASFINAEIVKKIPNGILPVSTYGVSDEMSDSDMAAAWVSSGWILTCNREINAIVSGTPFVMPITNIDLRTVDAAPANKTFHIFLSMKFGELTYRARTDSPPEGNSVMYIGTVTTNSSGIATRSFKTVLRIDTFRLSQTPIGSAIPVQGGVYDAAVAFPSTWNPV